MVAHSIDVLISLQMPTEASKQSATESDIESNIESPTETWHKQLFRTITQQPTDEASEWEAREREEHLAQMADEGARFEARVRAKG